MELKDQVALVTGGASGLGLATSRRLVDAGAHVIVADVNDGAGSDVVAELGDRVHFVWADVRRSDELLAAVDEARRHGPLRAVVHTAGVGGRPLRVVDKDGSPGSSAAFEDVVKTNLVGTFNVLSTVAAAMADNEPSQGDRGAVVLTSSTAAFEGQVGQIAYSAAKAGIVGLTLCAARDLASRGIRVSTLAPGVMDTPLLGAVPDDIKTALGQSVPHPQRLGMPEEYAALALEILRNGYLNGETVRLDGAARLAPR
ncbi:3-hydroxy-2-methylbutyryl-CoA dehydrogenase [Streptomyces albus]|uniref:3-hydroxy-2-methylbutyryl-CoA dehydrogenase n=1 Tax=Streptomyces albus (strain ATCC 21838 / DSM 41398 / FERM P-419 / JCM 4703 / NBRC 107858) TaxID=1081613 RepID=A0A0B5EGH3_STRA4|nr:3-hydroxy-2-methylbutyryl-CoA dehydrogenase [Streptomyces albus]AOU74739.1 3-hydroxy-2-methylbutyryl-CoA dehydrogenase [Streptomyces albus]AYN30550.1 3-hydroxy-2-methylbutyryl-CoA dehydrogenase [Streptomyces albus]